MLIAAVVSPAPSSASYTVSARRPRWRSFRFTIVSRRPCVSPAARIAANDDPYSTRRPSRRCHQTRCGISWTSPCTPVAIDARQTGVSEGKVEVERRYVPCSRRNRSAGVSAASSVVGVRPSITTRTTGFGGATGSVPGERAEPCVAVGRARPQPQAERRYGHGLEVAQHRDEREHRESEGDTADDQREPAARSATAKGAGDDGRGTSGPGDTADGGADAFRPADE